MVRDKDIVVIGAGLVGCVLSKMLSAKGYSVSIFEKRKHDISRPIGNGRSTHLIISQRGAKALEKINMLDEVLRNSIPLIGRMVHEEDSSLSQVKYGINRQAIYAIQRESLNRMLVDACSHDPNIEIDYGYGCESIDMASNQLVLNADGLSGSANVRAKWIFVCDGAKSKFRSQLINVNGFNYVQAYEGYGYKELIIPKENANDLSTEFMHAWPRGSFSLFAFPNSDGSFTATLMSPLDESGFGGIKNKSDLEMVFRKNFSDLDCSELVNEYFEKPICFLKSSWCSPWSFNDRILLLGDAAHTMLPFLGQGMNCGFEDCVIFNEMLDAHAGDFGRAISLFEEHRKKDSDCITTMSRMAFNEFTVEMGNKEYLYEKYIENKICELSEGRLKNAYQMLAFSCTPYCDINENANLLKSITSEVLLRLGSIKALADRSEQQVNKVILDSIGELEYEYAIN